MILAILSWCVLATPIGLLIWLMLDSYRRNDDDTFISAGFLFCIIAVAVAAIYLVNYYDVIPKAPK